MLKFAAILMLFLLVCLLLALQVKKMKKRSGEEIQQK